MATPTDTHAPARTASSLRNWLLQGHAPKKRHFPGPHVHPAADAQDAPLVAGHVPHRRRLLLHPGLPARHRGAGGRAALAARHAGAGRADPVRRPAGLPAGGRGEPPRRGVDRDAGAAAAVLEGQALRPGPARLRRDVLDRHDDPVGRGRDGAHRGEPARALGAARARGGHHPGAARAARGGVPQGVHRGDRGGRRPGRRVPRAERRRGGRGPVGGGHGAGPGHRLVGRADHPARQPGDDARRPRCWCSPRWRWACPASRPAWR